MSNPALAFGGGTLGDQGQAVDGRLCEVVLQKKELDQGPSYFQLQHMLNTKLTDELRYPLKLENLVVMRLHGGHDPSKPSYYPMVVKRAFGGNSLLPFSVHNLAFKLNTPLPEEQPEAGQLQGCIMYVDPAGGGKNGDETAYAVTGFLNGNIFLLAAGGLPGGYGIEQMNRLADIALRWRVNKVIVEKNMGYGAFREVWLPILRAKYECGVEDDMVNGQKELRIVETLEPVISRGALIVNEAVIEEDRLTSAGHEPAKRSLFSLFHQLSKMTRDRGALFHDDRADALEGAVRYWVNMLAINQDHAVQRQQEREFKRWAADPLRHNQFKPPTKGGPSILSRYLRR